VGSAIVKMPVLLQRPNLICKNTTARDNNDRLIGKQFSHALQTSAQMLRMRQASTNFNDHHVQGIITRVSRGRGKHFKKGYSF
jgi:hypothetical protein